MSKQQPQSGLVPRLRFPEFRETGEWRQSSFKKLGLDVGDGNYSSKYPKQSDFIMSGVPFLRANNLRFGTVSDEDMRFISERQHSELKKGHLKKGDILLSTRGELGIVALVPERHVGSNINAQLVRINTQGKLHNQFLFHLLDFSRAIGLFDALSTGTALKQLPIDKLNQLSLLIPVHVAEQQKIADCLSSLDALIAAQADKLDALKTHKKGLMQQLFPREGETVPCLRFPEFREAGEWDSCSLGDITQFSSGGTPSKDIAEYWGGSIPWISASSMYETNISKSELNVTALAIGNGTRIAKKGSLLILVRGSMLFNRVPIGIATIDVAFNQDVKALEVNNDISETFLLFQLISLESRIPINETGIGAGKIDTDHLKRLAVFIPSIEEQQKIADCFSSIDALIAAQADKFDALKAHKKGLMQQLFPSPEA